MPKVTTGIRFDKDVLDRLKERARLKGTTVSRAVNGLCKAALSLSGKEGVNAFKAKAQELMTDNVHVLPTNRKETLPKEHKRPVSKKGPPSDNWLDYLAEGEYDELDGLNPITTDTDIVDVEYIAKLRMQIAHLQHEGKDVTERKAVLSEYMQHVARVRAGTHRPPEGTPWTQDFSGLDVKEPPSGWGVYIPEFGYGMIDWLWYTKEEGFPEPKTVEEVKKKLDERKRLRQDPASRPRADFGKKKMTIFEHKP